MEEAGQRIETAMRKGKAVAKTCKRCGTGIDKRKTYCGPCCAENIAANRHKYRRKP